jgi:hypothetical protein
MNDITLGATAMATAAEIQADAEKLAAHYGYDVDRLRFQWDRRSFGSFALTLAGSPRERDRYRRAWELAVERQDAQGSMREATMEVKCLEIRDAMTFLPVICIRPVPENEAQRYLLRRDGYAGHASERCIILIDAQCRACAYDPYHWPANPRTKRQAHLFILDNWHKLNDGDVIDVEFILNERTEPKVSERERAQP